MPLWKILVTTTLFLSFNLISHASDTTLRFEIPEPDFDLNKIYLIDDLYDSEIYYSPNQRINETFYTYRPQTKYREKNFLQGSVVDNYFVTEFVGAQNQMKQQLASELLSLSLIKYVNSIDIIHNPVAISLGVRGNAIALELSGIELIAKATLRLSGWEEVICGSSPTVTVTAEVDANGSYNLASGLASVDNVSLNQTIDIDCSSILGVIFKPVIDYLADDWIDDAVSGVINPLLMTSVYIGPIENLLSDEAREAGQILGFDIVDDGWNALSRYVDGLTLRFDIGVDYYAPGSHLLGFAVSSEPVEFTYTSTGGAWHRLTYGHFTCPSWATKLKAYKAEKAVTGYVRNGRKTVAVTNGRKFIDLNIPEGTTNFKVLLGCEGRLCGVGDGVFTNYVASCESANGLWSYQDASGEF
jgi:hypothetical protein